MTCVNCSTAIENGLTMEFKNKGLVPKEDAENTGVSVVLLMNKMRIAFHKELAIKHKIDSNTIVSEVEDLGFGAELTNTHEIINMSERGSVDMETGQRVVQSVQQFKESIFIITGMTCTNCSSAIENHFNTSVEGAISISVSLMTNKAVIKHDLSLLRPRKIISEIEDLGFEAELQPTND